MGSSTTTRNFGMRRFTNLVREGRFRAPASGTELMLGTMVEIDPNDTDRVRQATSTAIGGGTSTHIATCGILWYEHDSQTFNDPRFGGAAGLLPQDLNTAPNDRMVQVLHGPGAKVWLRNTEASTTEPGLNFDNTRSAVTMVSGLTVVTPSVAVDDMLGWNTSGYWAVTTTESEGVLRVTKVYDGEAKVDAEFLI